MNVHSTAHAPDEPHAPPAAGPGRSFSAARRHSVIVRVLKVTIPVGATIAIAAVLVVSFFNPFGRIPGLSVGPITVSGSKIAMEAPRMTGFRKDKRPYEVTATTAYQDIRKPNVIELVDMKARLAIDDLGAMARLVSKSGVYDNGRDHLELNRDIRITTDRGEEVLLRSASIDLKAGTAVSRETVKVTTPTMTVDAEGVELSENGTVITFAGRVRTVMTPAREKADAVAGPAKPPSGKAEAAKPGPAGIGSARVAEAGERP